MKKIVIIGSGNVAEALALSLAEQGMAPVQIYARNVESGSALAARCGAEYAGEPAQLAPADLYLIAVSDRAIASVSGSLDFGDAIVAHTSGSTPVDALSSKIRHRAVLYPLQSFTKGRSVDFREIPLMIEGCSAKALECVREVAGALSDRVLEVDSHRRAAVHLAAVFVSNFVNYMYTIGEELLADTGMDFSLLKPLILETARKAVESSSPRRVQTGPAVRNDFQTKNLHCEMLVDKPDLKNIYINLSNQIWETSKKISRK